MSIRFGPAGLGGVKEAISNLEKYHKLGLKACEIAFTYGVYIKDRETAEKIGKKAKELGIQLSIHAPYYINLNSSDKSKLEKSKQRILECLKAGTWLNVDVVVFHPGYYGKMEKQETYDNIKKAIIEIQKQAKEKHYTSKLAPETTGKINVFGSIDEIAKLKKETNCRFCIDFAHILAREKDYKFKEVFEKFKDKEIHIHFSGINYGLKGELSHKKTPETELRKLLHNVPKNRDTVIINESPSPVEDSIRGLKMIK
jgi:deoxyribonuclease IV